MGMVRLVGRQQVLTQEPGLLPECGRVHGEAVACHLADLALDPRCRAEQISLEQFAELFRRLPRG